LSHRVVIFVLTKKAKKRKDFGVAGIEPAIMVSKTSALPLGYTPDLVSCTSSCLMGRTWGLLRKKDYFYFSRSNRRKSGITLFVSSGKIVLLLKIWNKWLEKGGCAASALYSCIRLLSYQKAFLFLSS
jgi:hypothetical protein